jgi:hypothetical protein
MTSLQEVARSDGGFAEVFLQIHAVMCGKPTRMFEQEELGAQFVQIDPKQYTLTGETLCLTLTLISQKSSIGQKMGEKTQKTQSLAPPANFGGNAQLSLNHPADMNGKQLGIVEQSILQGVLRAQIKQFIKMGGTLWQLPILNWLVSFILQ